MADGREGKGDMQTMERWGIIYSPKSGVRHTHRRWEQIRQCLDEFQVEYDFVQSEARDSELRLAEMLVKNGYRTLIVVGGDGALNRVLNGILSLGSDILEEVRLGVIPNGHGNDFAEFWGFEEDDPRKSVEWLVKGRVRKVDLGVLRCGDREHYFLNCVSMGLVATIIDLKRKAYHFWGLSSLSHLTSMFLLLFQRLEKRIRLLINHERIDKKVMTICIGSAHGYGLTPNAVPYNGMLDVSVVSHPAIAQLVEGMGLLVTGRFLNHRNVKAYRTQQVVTVEEMGRMKVSADGQVLHGIRAPFQVSVLQERVNFIIPT